jgi:hypothetical protein
LVGYEAFSVPLLGSIAARFDIAFRFDSFESRKLAMFMAGLGTMCSVRRPYGHVMPPPYYFLCIFMKAADIMHLMLFNHFLYFSIYSALIPCLAMAYLASHN